MPTDSIFRLLGILVRYATTTKPCIMTAEIAVYNRHSIALAADSLVSIASEEGVKKSYNVNKLFGLSKFHPVGVMIFGNAAICDVPWETIIKMYRRKLNRDSFPSVREYAEHFRKFLCDSTNIFSDPGSDRWVLVSAVSFLLFLKQGAVDEIQETYAASIKPPDDEELISIASRVTSETIEIFAQKPRFSTLSETFEEKLLAKYKDEVETHAREIFDFGEGDEDEDEEDSVDTSQRRLLIEEDVFNKAVHFATTIISRDSSNETGVVIAGFGDDEVFPAINCQEIHGMAVGELVWTQKFNAQAGADDEGGIIPFAQRDVVDTFLNGISEPTNKLTLDYFSEFFEILPDKILSQIPNLEENLKNDLDSKLSESLRQILVEYQDKLKEFSELKYVVPLRETIEVLPKEELAAVAESLVGMTSLRRKMSLEVETVGGPVDVALITKGDGFIWMKRKHYFDPALNHHFFTEFNFKPEA